MKPSLVIVGLGNPGKNYSRTRHNAGFMAVEKLGEKFGTGKWRMRQKFMSDIMEARVAVAPALLVKPFTYMNRSGECVRKIVDFFGIDSTRVLVIADDIDLDAGETRLRLSGGAGTHNGLKSVVEQLGENFPRLRIGIRGETAPQSESFRKSGNDLASYVLSVPTERDGEKIESALAGAAETVKGFVLGTET